MCGIAGVYDYGFSRNPQVTPELLTRMSDRMIHRGPDDAGFGISRNGQCGLTFRRLAIVDLSPAGHQPMSTPDGRFTIVFNGEIYNHLEIRQELEAKGYQYRSRSDTETILYAYTEWGEECFKKFLGMFAIAIWDEESKEVFIIRDRIGIKPLYYTNPDGRFLWASEIKVLLEHPTVKTEFNEGALPHYLSLLMPPAPETMFKGINKLEAGHSLRISSKGDITKKRWWSLLDAGPLADSLTENEAVDDLRFLLRRSIKDRMMSDVPFGVFLSGGIDSSLNVALMSELMDRPVQTFTVGFTELEKYNELSYARQIAEKFKTNHHEILIDSKTAQDKLSDLAWHEDEPNGDPVCIPLYFVSKLARDNGTIVVQVGEGSDEEFLGYPWMIRDLKFRSKYWKQYVPKAIRRAGYLATKPFIKHPLMREYLRRYSEGEEFFWGGAVAFTEEHKAKLFRNYSKERHSSYRFPELWHREINERYPNSEYQQRMMYLEFQQRLPQMLLMRVDKVSMATSIEARVPFLDHRIVEYAFRMPMHIKLGKKMEPKYILKKASEGILPYEHIYRKKQGFAAPVAEWLKKDLKPMFDEYLASSRIVRDYLDLNSIKALQEEHLSGIRKNADLLWSLLNLMLWERRYFG
ncbi:MAG: asparagine synthase (glutamine-hydrolyzing) [Bacteroidota bacterium]|nr:asparagine synthase (glutamine-hydrolyzing) [Bacteroidota bacterium]MDP4236799.1 asparagine synthase (glutamine-hydrolyzing) [Bacteroidota bacterium]